jgi:hypothetical protein
MAPDREAQFLASLAVAAAEAYLGGRSNAYALGEEADRIACRVLVVSRASADVPDALSNAYALGEEADRIACRVLVVSSASADVPDALRLLVVAMRRTSVALGAQQARWSEVMAALCKLVRHEAVVIK